MQKLQKAKVQIILKSPFFASLMLRRQFIEDRSIETACTNGKVIRYNSDFIESLSLGQIQGVIIHELLHITNLHHTRRENRNLAKWNLACDYAINPLIVDSGYELPNGALLNDEYRDMSAESIYNVLPDSNGDPENDSDGQGESDNDDGHNQSCGDVEDCEAGDESAIAQAEVEAKVELAQALQVAKMAGNIPAGLQRLVEEILKPKQNWRETLARFITTQCNDDYSWSRPNTRYISSGFILPSLHNLKVGKVVMSVDTSISIDEKTLNVFGGEVYDIATTFSADMTVIYCDTEVNKVETFEAGDDVKLEPCGGGGTDFIPPFVYVDQNEIEPSCLIYFTDGFCNSFPAEPDYPVLWAIYGGHKFTPPFGEVIYID